MTYEPDLVVLARIRERHHVEPEQADSRMWHVVLQLSDTASQEVFEDTPAKLEARLDELAGLEPVSGQPFAAGTYDSGSV
jgi:hypothetical protein